MITLYRMVLRSFIPVLIGAIFFFVLLLQLIDLFANLFQYLGNDASVADILTVSLYYLPRCLVLSLPMSLLFSVSFTLGDLYARNELIAIFGSGISLFRFSLMFIVLGIFASAGGMIFQEKIAVEWYGRKNQLSSELLGRTVSYSNSNVGVLSGGGKILYHAEYYNDTAKTLSGLTIVERNDSGGLIRRIDGEWASYSEDGMWEIKKARITEPDPGTEFLKEIFKEKFVHSSFREPPDMFRRIVADVNEMTIEEIGLWAESLKRAGLPAYREARTDYHERISFPFAALIVCILASAIGGRFKKNILLMNLLASLSFSVLYYVMKMVMTLLAKQGIIHPAFGAWSAFIVFTVFGFILFKNARN